MSLEERGRMESRANVLSWLKLRESRDGADLIPPLAAAIVAESRKWLMTRLTLSEMDRLAETDLLLLAIIPKVLLFPA